MEEVFIKTLWCRGLEGGILSDLTWINRTGGVLSAPAVTENDIADIQVAAESHADFLAVSFPKDAADMHRARELMQKAGGHAATVAKIERVEAIANLQPDAIAQQHGQRTQSWREVDRGANRVGPRLLSVGLHTLTKGAPQL